MSRRSSAFSAVVYRPSKTGSRFSKNARAPSAKSSEPASVSCAATSCSSVTASAGFAAASSTRFASPSARGAQASSSFASCSVAASSSSRRGDPVREADAVRLAPVDDLAGHDQLLGVAQPHDRGQPRAAAHVRDQPDANLHDPGHGVLGHRPEVARERELERAAERRAVDLADRGLRHLLEQVPPLNEGAPERAQPVGILRQRAQIVQIHSGREQRALAADDYHPNRRVSRGPLNALPQSTNRLPIQRIPFLGPVQHQMPNSPPVLLNYERHGVWGGYCSGKEGSA